MMISSNSDKSPTKHFLFPVLKRNQIRPKIPKKIGEIFLISKEEFSESLIPFYSEDVWEVETVLV